MPKNEPDPQDPNVLVGVSLPGDRDSLHAMAEAFAEEFAVLGYDEERLLRLFKHPGYKAAHRAFRVLGEDSVRRLIHDSVAVWGRFKVRVQDAPAPQTPPANGLELVQLGRPVTHSTKRPGQEKERSDV